MINHEKRKKGLQRRETIKIEKKGKYQGSVYFFVVYVTTLTTPEDTT
jgi:hypothetical protein